MNINALARKLAVILGGAGVIVSIPGPRFYCVFGAGETRVDNISFPSGRSAPDFDFRTLNPDLFYSVFNDIKETDLRDPGKVSDIIFEITSEPRANAEDTVAFQTAALAGWKILTDPKDSQAILEYLRKANDPSNSFPGGPVETQTHSIDERLRRSHYLDQWEHAGTDYHNNSRELQKLEELGPSTGLPVAAVSPSKRTGPSSKRVVGQEYRRILLGATSRTIAAMSADQGPQVPKAGAAVQETNLASGPTEVQVTNDIEGGIPPIVAAGSIRDVERALAASPQANNIEGAQPPIKEDLRPTIISPMEGALDLTPAALLVASAQSDIRVLKGTQALVDPSADSHHFQSREIAGAPSSVVIHK